MKRTPFFLFFVVQGTISSLTSSAITGRKTNTAVHEGILIAVIALLFFVCLWLWKRTQLNINPNAPVIFKKRPILIPIVALSVGVLVAVFLTVCF